MTASVRKRPRDLFWGLLLVCCAPLLLNRFGVDFGMEPLHWQQKGVVHALFVWTAVCAAAFSALLAMLMYRAMRDVVLPVIALALVCGAGFDLFHLLAAQRLMRVHTTSPDLLPFTWVIGRTCQALVPVVGAWLLLLRGPERPGKGRTWLLALTGIGILIGAHAAISAVAGEAELPRTIYPGGERVGGIVTRPFDLAPVLVTLAAALILYPRLQRRSRSDAVAVLWLSVMPFSAMQLHLVFGSQALFDNDFVIAHFLLIVTALVPLVGLGMVFANTFSAHEVARQRVEDLQLHLESRRSQVEELREEAEREAADRRRGEAELRSTREAMRRLYEAAYSSTHDLQQPLRELMHLADALHKDFGDAAPEVAGDFGHIDSALRRMETQVQSLLALTGPRAQDLRRERVALGDCVERALDMLGKRIAETKARIEVDALPEIWGDRHVLTRLFCSLLENALRRVGGRAPRIRVTVSQEGDSTVYGVLDNGARPDSEDLAAFFANGELRGHEHGGAELACKAIEQHRGAIWIEPQAKAGCHVRFTLEERARDAARAD
jgi:signal transduction histidine kinase